MAIVRRRWRYVCFWRYANNPAVPAFVIGPKRTILGLAGAVCPLLTRTGHSGRVGIHRTREYARGIC